jgi:predicted nucleic acid-binding protein
VSQAFVADSSVGISWASESQSSPLTENLLRQVESGTPFVVPSLWFFEISNTLLVLMRRKRIAPEQWARARLDLIHLSPIVDEEGPRLAMGKIADLASEHTLSVYDATYLELALRRGLPLASRDTVLIKAAKASGVETLI